MGRDKAIKAGKVWRRPFRRSRRFDRSCRNHGSCPYCRGSRLHSSRKRGFAALEMERDYASDGNSD